MQQRMWEGPSSMQATEAGPLCRCAQEAVSLPMGIACCSYLGCFMVFWCSPRHIVAAAPFCTVNMPDAGSSNIAKLPLMQQAGDSQA